MQKITQPWSTINKGVGKREFLPRLSIRAASERGLFSSSRSIADRIFTPPE
jgi:hypothetical protein